MRILKDYLQPSRAVVNGFPLRLARVVRQFLLRISVSFLDSTFQSLLGFSPVCRPTHWENCRKYIIKTLSLRTSASATCIKLIEPY